MLGDMVLLADGLEAAHSICNQSDDVLCEGRHGGCTARQVVVEGDGGAFAIDTGEESASRSGKVGDGESDTVAEEHQTY